MKSLKQFLGLCTHKWKIISQGQFKKDGLIRGSYYELQCEHCGDVKVRNLS